MAIPARGPFIAAALERALMAFSALWSFIASSLEWAIVFSLGKTLFAIYRTVSRGLERHFAFFTAIGAYRLMQYPLPEILPGLVMTGVAV